MMAFKVITFFSVLSEAVASMPRRLGKAAHAHNKNQNCTPAGYRQFLENTPVSMRKGLKLYECTGEPRSCQLICDGRKGFGGGSGEIKCTPKQGQKPNYEFVSCNTCTKGNTVSCGNGPIGAACAACNNRDGATCVLSTNAGVCSSGCCADPAEGITAPRTTAPRTTAPRTTAPRTTAPRTTTRKPTSTPCKCIDNPCGRNWTWCGVNENAGCSDISRKPNGNGWRSYKAVKEQSCRNTVKPRTTIRPRPVATRPVATRPVATRPAANINVKPERCTFDKQSTKWRCAGVPCKNKSQCYPPMKCVNVFFIFGSKCC